MNRRLQVRKLGRVEYADGLRLMALAGYAVRSGIPATTDFLFVLEHPPVITLGRGAKSQNVIASREWLAERGFEVHETDRGGDVTYHGPGQLVAYPVVDLSDRPDVRKYVATLEEAMIRVCAGKGVPAARHREHRGVWVGEKKIGAVGVHLARWITSHGLAFNVAPNLLHFRAIVPCGIVDPRLGVTSLAQELATLNRAAPVMEDVEDELARCLADLLGRECEMRPPDLHTISVTPIGSDGRVLLLRRRLGGFWQPVTGRIESGETPEAAARRELFEETGAEATVAPLGYRHAFGIEPELLGGGARGPLVAEETAFVAHLPAGFSCRLSDEHTEHGWYRPPEALAVLHWEGLRRAVKLATASGIALR